VFAESGFAETDIRHVIEAAQGLAANWSKLTSAETSEILRRSLVKIVTNGSAVQIQVDLRALSECIEKKDSGCSVAREGQPRAAAHLTTLTVPLTVARHRGELRLVLPGPDKLYGNSNSSLLKALVRALQWKRRVVGGEIYNKQQLAREANLNASYVGRILKLAALSPECIDAVVQHGKTFDQQLSEILGTISLDWDKQTRLLRQIRIDHCTRHTSRTPAREESGKNNTLWPTDSQSFHRHRGVRGVRRGSLPTRKSSLDSKLTFSDTDREPFRRA
jgi:hypothetical protein